MLRLLGQVEEEVAHVEVPKDNPVEVNTSTTPVRVSSSRTVGRARKRPEIRLRPGPLTAGGLLGIVGSGCVAVAITLLSPAATAVAAAG